MVKASEAFRFKKAWTRLQKRGMEENFSWEKSALDYDKMYREILGLPPEEVATEPEKELAK